MPLYICPHCEARNTEAGRCVSCLEPLGSRQRAIAAAFITSGALAALWIIFSAITKLELIAMACGFGVIVSALTVRISGGHGPSYQAIASLATIIGILVADSIVMLVLLSPEGFGLLPRLSYDNWVAVFDHFFNRDNYTFIFMSVGVMSGLFIWRPA